MTINWTVSSELPGFSVASLFGAVRWSKLALSSAFERT